MKNRDIIINLSEVYKDIDSLTYKYAEVSEVPSPSVRNGMQSDTTESLDGHVLARAVEYRDARLRAEIGRFLRYECQTSVTDELRSRNTIVYRLSLDDEFQDALLRPVCTIIHRYLVFGALFDWYGPGMGSRQAQNYERELTELEVELTNNLNAVTIVQKVKQPFGRRLY